jgi:hypothetical protein
MLFTRRRCCGSLLDGIVAQGSSDSSRAAEEAQRCTAQPPKRATLQIRELRSQPLRFEGERRRPRRRSRGLLQSIL